jgi:DNA-binding Lrp family transcriptional regulator
MTITQNESGSNPKYFKTFEFLTTQIDESGQCRITEQEIAEGINVDRRTVIRHIKDLEKLQFIKVIPGRPNTYLFLDNEATNEMIDKATSKETPQTDIKPYPNLTVLRFIKDLDRILLIGGMGVGKTELLRHLAFEKVQDGGRVVIADPHAAPDTWPSFVEVIGKERNYTEIKETIDSICDELDERYKQRAMGQKHFGKLTLIIDELFVLNQNLDLKKQFKSLLAESRKVSIGLIVAGHSDRAKAIGLLGNKDLVEGFDARVYLRKENGQYICRIQNSGDHERTYFHPGPFIDPTVYTFLFGRKMPVSPDFKKRRKYQSVLKQPKPGEVSAVQCDIEMSH